MWAAEQACVDLFGTRIADMMPSAGMLNFKPCWEYMDGMHADAESHQMQAGDTLYTASMKPIMTFLEESGPGCHDTTAAACSYGLYVLQIGEVRPLSPKRNT